MKNPSTKLMMIEQTASRGAGRTSGEVVKQA